MNKQLGEKETREKALARAQEEVRLTKNGSVLNRLDQGTRTGSIQDKWLKETNVRIYSGKLVDCFPPRYSSWPFVPAY